MSKILASDPQLLKDLECPVCMEYMIGKILLCGKGHSVCFPCQDKLNPNICPTCKSEFTGGRNYKLEKLVLNFNFPCQNEGCSIVLPAEKMRDDHKYSCDYRINSCILDFMDCKWRGTLKDLKGHISSVHFECMNQWFEANYLLHFFKGTFIKILKNDNEIFMVFKNTVATRTTTLFVATCAGNFKCYNLRIELSQNNNTRFKYSFEGPCISRSALTFDNAIGIPNDLIEKCNPPQFHIIQINQQ